PERLHIGGAQEFFTLFGILLSVNRASSVNDKLSRQVEARRNNRLTRPARCQLVTGSLKSGRSRCFEDSSANSTTHLQFGVGSIDYGVNFHLCYVLTDDGKWH